MTPVRAALHDYLTIRRRLGFTLIEDGRLLEGFVRFLEQAGATRITTELALAWSKLPAEAHPYWWRRRLGLVRGFAKYLATIDPASEVPSKDLLPAYYPRVAPYIYSPAEIAALIDAARKLKPRQRALRHEALIGLLTVTGMRPGEALALDRNDVDLAHGLLRVHAGKQQRQRELALHDTTTNALREYACERDRRFPTPTTPAFFISQRGRRIVRQELNQTFARLIGEVGLEGRGGRVRPRPYDLRHAFAVRTLLDWHREGADVDRKLPLLSTWLGHVNPTSTYWYLEAVPELLELIARRLDRLAEELS
jgi:integrase/recombinase XerD